MVNNYIWITTQFAGVHSYIDAPEEVAFLRNEHRHIFHARVYIEIFHDDRDIEFILFKRFVESLIIKSDFDYMSCEMISDELALKIKEKYTDRRIIIEISEDGENGSRKEYEII